MRASLRMEIISKSKEDSLNKGKVISVRGSVVDIWFDADLTPVYSQIHTG